MNKITIQRRVEGRTPEETTSMSGTPGVQGGNISEPSPQNFELPRSSLKKQAIDAIHLNRIDVAIEILHKLTVETP